jgi:hypothetical protein
VLITIKLSAVRMKFLVRIIFLFFILTVPSSFTIKRIDYREGMHNNVCKVLKNNILVYFVFVDTRTTAPWTEYDIRSTLDSMDVAVRWIEDQARQAGIPLNIRTDYYIGSEYTTVRKNLAYGTVMETAKTPNTRKGLAELNKWADGIAARIGKDVHITTKDGIPEIKNPRNKERLVAHLRDVHQLESVALLYLVNNYYRNDISLAVNHMHTNDIEFAITSYKYPSVIAQNILNLFGAADLSKTLYRKNEKKIKLAAEYFPYDIMQDVYAKSVNELEIGEFTQYLIGWKDKLDQKYQVLLTDGFANF